VSAHRGELVTALLTLSHAWYVAGQPPAPTPTLGGFEAWTRTIGGILQYVGIPDFLGNLEDLYAQVDEGDSGQWTAFLAAWLATYGDRLIAVAELTDDLLIEGSALREVLPDDLADALPTRDSDTGRFRRKLGHALESREMLGSLQNSGRMACAIYLSREPGEAPVCASNCHASCVMIRVMKRPSPMSSPSTSTLNTSSISG
jgi:hypothetical protein